MDLLYDKINKPFFIETPFTVDISDKIAPIPHRYKSFEVEVFLFRKMQHFVHFLLDFPISRFWSNNSLMFFSFFGTAYFPVHSFKH